MGNKNLHSLSVRKARPFGLPSLNAVKNPPSNMMMQRTVHIAAGVQGSSVATKSSPLRGGKTQNQAGLGHSSARLNNQRHHR